jgi:ankyrin repeat protein
VLDQYVRKVGTDKLHELTSAHCQSPNPEFVSRLIGHGVSPNNTDWLGRTSLHLAVEEGNVAVADRLLEHGADLESIDLHGSTTPLGYAARKGHLEMVQFLMDKGADPHAPAHREWARPLAYAEFEGQTEVVEMLRKHGV